MYRIFTGIALLLLLSGCQVQQSALPELREIVVVNDNPHAVTDFQIRVPATGAVYGCSYIPSGGECSSRFPSRKVRNNMPVITWAELGELKYFTPQGRGLPDNSEPWYVVFHIAAGELKIKLYSK